MGLVLLVLILIAYNNLLNLWRPFNGPLYVPLNVAAAAGLLAWGLWGFGLTAGELGLDGASDGLPEAGAGLLLGAAVTAPLFLLLLSRRAASRIADERVAHLDGSGVAYQVLLRIPFGTALLEEVAFRGVLLAALEGADRLDAAIGSSIVFGLWHIGPTRNAVLANDPSAGTRRIALAAAGAVLVTAAAGLLLVGLRWRFGSLWAPWAFHATVNGLATLAAVAAHRRTLSARGEHGP